RRLRRLEALFACDQRNAVHSVTQPAGDEEKTMNRLLTIASHSALIVTSVCGMMAAPSLASDLSGYRSFQFGMDLAAVAGQAGPDKSEVKVIHSRPALIQEIEWSPQLFGSTSREESVQQVVLRFYDGKLFGIVVNYDRYKTE